MSVIGLFAALGALIGTTVLGFYVEPGLSTFEILIQIASEHNARHMVAVAMGAAAALAWLGRLFYRVSLKTVEPERSESDTSVVRPTPGMQFMEQVVIAASITGVAGSAGLLLWNTLFDLKSESPTRAFAQQFVIDQIAEIPFLPTRLAIDDSGNLYVSYFWAENDATHGGGIIKLTEVSETGSFTQETVANSDLLFRTVGLAAKDGDLYVSRSGYHARAEAGKLLYEDSGAITQLRDLNGDGYFEYYHDILTGIPGGRGPHIQHQNNGIAFAPDGSLFVTNAFASIGLDEHPLGGAVLKLSPDFENVTLDVWLHLF